LQIIERDDIKNWSKCKPVEALLLRLRALLIPTICLRFFSGRAKENGAEFVFNTEVIRIERKSGSYRSASG